MKATKTIISTLREAPNDAVIASHQLMMRSGLIRKLGNGLYAYMPFGFRSLMKVEKIIREELDEAGLLEIKPTVIVPGDLWKESGRWDKMAGEMLTAQNRQGQDMVVSPTAEEAFTLLQLLSAKVFLLISSFLSHSIRLIQNTVMKSAHVMV